MSHLHEQLRDLHSTAAPYEKQLAGESDELERLIGNINSRPADIQEQKMVVGSLEAKLSPLHERIEQLEAMLPSAEDVETAKKEEAKHLRNLEKKEREHAERVTTLLAELLRVKEIADELNTTKRERLELTATIRQLRDAFDLDERNRHFVKFPETEGQRRAYALATFLKESVYGLPSDTLERELAALQPQAEVAS